jgi:hypothetical protein
MDDGRERDRGKCSLSPPLKDADDRGTGRGRLLKKLGIVAKDFKGKCSEIDEKRAKEGALTFGDATKQLVKSFTGKDRNCPPAGQLSCTIGGKTSFQNQDKTKTWLEFDFEDMDEV